MNGFAGESGGWLDRISSVAGIRDRLSKSCCTSPSGNEGGAMRWRLGVEGALSLFSFPGSRLSSSLIDLRRFFAPRGGPPDVCRAALPGRRNMLEDFSPEYLVWEASAVGCRIGLGRSVGAQRICDGDCEMFEERRP